jgi:hypothetical protein
VDLRDWDFLWEPPPWQSHQRHAWADQHQPDSGVYLVPKQGYQDTNYHVTPVLHRLADQQHWHIPEWIDADSIDRRWSPDPKSPPYIYEFPVEWGWDRTGGPQYRVPGATEKKFCGEFLARTLPAPDMVSVFDDLDTQDPVLRWRPHPDDPPYEYVFGNQWYPAEQRCSIKFTVPGASQQKFMTWPRATRKPNADNFRLIEQCDFDWSWEPDPGSPPYIYVFGNQWWSAEKMPTVEYRVPCATQRKFMTEPRARLDRNLNDYWHVLEECTWDSTWCPDPGDPPYIYVFGNQWWPAETWPTLEYRVPGATQRKYLDTKLAKLLPDRSRWTVPDGIDPDSVDYSWRPDPGSPPYRYEFGTQWQKTGGATYIMPDATDVKYTSAFRCKKVNHDEHWYLPEDLKNLIDGFDWTWHPDSTEQPYIYEFGTQHQKTGGLQYRVPGATERKYVEQVRVEVKNSRAAVVLIDHLDGHAATAAEQIVSKASLTRTVRFVNSYLDTLKRVAKNINDEWVWIASSVCDYKDFDFTWYPEQWQSTMLHVFKSDDQKFGDTFFMHVPTFDARSSKIKLLEWYDINFVPVSVPRRPLPVIHHARDSHVEPIVSCVDPSPLSLFTCMPDPPDCVPAVNLWRPETRAVTPLDQGSCQVIVPREACGSIQTQVYDYPYIDKSHAMNPGTLCDVIFISNGEPMAQSNFETLLAACPRTKHSQGVQGRERAYKAAAAMSDTDWFYAVFAKTEVLDTFDFSFQPDRLQAPKHYIFHSRNPLNGLEYGAMNINLYNKDLVLKTVPGLDFTLSAAHEVVPILASISRFNTDPWVTWRSAFREVLKLKREVDLGADVEIQYRLRIWCTKAQGDNSEHCLQGAKDALEYYDRVEGDLNALMNSFDWDWLQKYYYSKYQQTPWS